MTYHIHITAETLENAGPLSSQVFADLMHSVGRGLSPQLYITEVRATKVLSSHVSTFRGPRKPRPTAKPLPPLT